MARARNLKPGFFRNADLAELPFEARLLFAGLWTLADRDGRLEDKAKQIKIELFPADNVDCDALLDLICKTKMLERYEVDGVRYLQVVNFNKHQNPHRDEKPSTIPVNDKHSANTVQTPCKPETSTVAIGLTPDSGFLTADSLIPDSSVTDVTAIDDGKTPDELTKAELWAAGKSILSEQGMPKAQCGSFVGKLVKDYGDGVVIDAVRAAVVQRPADAAQYLVATCQTAMGQRKPANKQEALEARNRAVADAWANEQEAAIESV